MVNITVIKKQNNACNFGSVFKYTLLLIKIVFIIHSFYFIIIPYCYAVFQRSTSKVNVEYYFITKVIPTRWCYFTVLSENKEDK